MTQIIEDTKLDFSDVLLVPKRSSLDSRSKVDLLRTFKFKHSPVQYTGTGIIAANMDSVGTIEMAQAFKSFGMSVALHKFYTDDVLIKYFSDPNRNPHTFYSMGITDEDFNKFTRVSLALSESGKIGLQYICIDVANGYSRKFVKFVEKMRSKTSAVIMAGNVVTGDMVYDLLERGADIVKVGIGPGSVCTTRRITGVGYPQLSAILECQDAAHGADGLICGDGGIVVPGDLSKAFAGGADFVMCGGIFAGHSECAGELYGSGLDSDNIIVGEPCRDFASLSLQYTYTVLWTHKKTKETAVVKVDEVGRILHKSPLPLSFYREPENLRMRYYGMSSHEAMDKHYGGKANYRASEGKVVEVPYKGYVAGTIEEMLGGLRSACTYIGARRLKDMAKCATFVKTNRQLNNSLSEYNV